MPAVAPPWVILHLPPPIAICLLYSIAVSPHSQLLVAAATIGGAVVLAAGVLLGLPYGFPEDTGATHPTLIRESIVDVDAPPDQVSQPGVDPGS